MPAKYSVAMRWMVPGPVVPKVMVSGFALASAQLLDARHRHFVRDREHVRNRRHENDRVELLHRIGQRAVEQRVEHEGLVGGEGERVAVRRGLGAGDRADQRVAAGAVLDHDALAPFLRELLSEQPHQHVGCAACGERHDDVNRLGGEIERGGGERRQDRSQDADKGGDGQAHGCSVCRLLMTIGKAARKRRGHQRR
jgi:hypothetical protein